MFFRDFSFFPDRLVFVGPPPGGPPEAGISPVPVEPVQPPAAPPEADTRSLEEIEQDRQAQLRQTQEEQKRLRDTLNSGTADKYIETFRTSTSLDVLTSTLEMGMSVAGTGSLFNFENWVNADGDDLAELFTNNKKLIESFGGLDKLNIFPEGPGRDAFVEGLRLQKDPQVLDQKDETPETQEKRRKSIESGKALREIIKILREQFEIKRATKEDTGAQAEKTPLGDTIGTGFKSLIRSFNRAPGMEKLAIGAAVGIAIALIYKYRDSQVIPFFKDAKLSTVAMWVGAFWGVNYLSGKMSADGKTLLQRLDVSKSIDDMSDKNILKGYAYRHEYDKDEEKMRTLNTIAEKGVSIKTLFEIYEEASQPAPAGTKREIDPRRLGFFNNEVNGAHLYEIMDNLVKETSVNEHIRALREEAQRQGKTYPTPSPTDPIVLEWMQPANARETFRKKYVTGPLGASDQTFMDAVFNEYYTANLENVLVNPISGARTHKYQRDTAAGQARELPAAAAAEVGEAWTGTVKPFVENKAAWIAATGGDVGRFLRDNAAYPFGRWIAARYNQIAPYVGKQIDTAEVWYAKTQWLSEVFPDDLDVQILNPDSFFPGKPGEMSVMGLPGFKFSLTQKEDPRDGKIKKVIEVVGNNDFFLEDKKAGDNAPKLAALEGAVKAKVTDLFNERAQTTPQLAGRIPEWDKANKKWVVKNIPYTVDPALYGGVPRVPPATTDLNFKISPDGRSLKFMAGTKEFDNFGDLDILERDAEIEKAIWNTDPRLKPFLENLPVTDINVTSGAITATIKGKIAGLEFEAIPKRGSIANGVEFVDPLGGPPGGFDKLVINPANGGDEFLNKLGGKVLHEDINIPGAPPAGGVKKFREPFNLLQARMDTVYEGIASKWKEFNKTQRLWIIPTNFKGAITGKILQNRWNTTLLFKQYETLRLFQTALTGKTLDQIPIEFDFILDKARQQLADLDAFVASLPDSEKANQFQDLLTRQERTVNVPTTPPTPVNVGPGIEYLNYTNVEYRQQFEKYQTMISKFDYEGLDESGTAQEIYLTLLSVWSFQTGHFAGTPPPNGPLAVGDKAICDSVIRKVEQKLTLALQADNGNISALTGGPVIKKDNLPGKCSLDPRELNKWMQ